MMRRALSRGRHSRHIEPRPRVRRVRQSSHVEREFNRRDKKIQARYHSKKSACHGCDAIRPAGEGFLSKDDMTDVARLLEMEPVEVERSALSIRCITSKPVGRNHVQVCRKSFLFASRRRAPRAPHGKGPRHKDGADHKGRQGHVIARRVPRKLRHGSDDADKRRLLREPHRRKSERDTERLKVGGWKRLF